MVKLRGPMMSLAASGSFGKTITYGKARDNPWARLLVKPGNPQTGPQISMRAAIKFLSQQWSELGPTNQATYQALADASQVAPYHSYCKFNAQRHRNELAPSMAYPATEAETTSTLDVWTAVAGVREITVSFSDLDDADWNWAAIIYGSTTDAFTAGFTNVLKLITAADVDVVSWVHGPLQPATWYYRLKFFTEYGAIGPLSAQINATIS